MSIDRGTFYQSRVPEVYGATITLEVVATIAVIARLVSRKLAVTKYWWDDLSIVLAWVRNIKCWFLKERSIANDPKVLVSGICACVWFQYGRYGRHNVAYGGPVGPKETVIYLKVGFSCWLVKMSFADQSFNLSSSLSWPFKSSTSFQQPPSKPPSFFYTGVSSKSSVGFNGY